jgi:hypothetical protein
LEIQEEDFLETLIIMLKESNSKQLLKEEDYLIRLDNNKVNKTWGQEVVYLVKISLNSNRDFSTRCNNSNSNRNKGKEECSKMV